MEPIEIVLIVVGIVWAILCVILFFKLWGMCNNVSSILQILIDHEYDEKEKATPQRRHDVANPPKKKNKKIEDSQNNMMAFNNECLSLFKQCKSKLEFENQVEDIIAKYNKIGEFDYSTLKDGMWEQFKLL